jgi:ankyrin repeat protein
MFDLFRAVVRTPAVTKEAVMPSPFRRALPARPDLGAQKKLAKDLLRAYRASDAEAIARFRAELPDKRDIALADAQFVLAREYGFSNWSELTHHIESVSTEQLPAVEQFKHSVRRRDAKALRRVLQRSAEARAAINNPIFSFDTTSLLAAGNDLDVVNVLLEFGADPNKKSNWWAGGFHVLYSARGEVAERLLAAGAIPDACAAAHLDRPELLAEILAANPSRVHERGGDGKMPLHFARSRRVADMLLDAGADIDARDIDHRSTAAEWMLGDDPNEARWELATYLVERGASADIFLCAALGLTDRARALLEKKPSLLALRTSQGDYGEKRPSSFHIYQWTIGPNFTPLQTAAKFGKTETMLAMEAFATPEQRLLLACHLGDADKARAVVAAHPKIVEQLQGADRRALTDEAWTANAPAVELMLELGFDPAVPSTSGPTGGTALHCACWEGSVPCVEAILRYPAGRALLETKDRTYGGTPLSWCRHGSFNCGSPRADHAAVARVLIAAGAFVPPEMADLEGSDAFIAVIESAVSRSS